MKRMAPDFIFISAYTYRCHAMAPCSKADRKAPARAWAAIILSLMAMAVAGQGARETGRGRWTLGWCILAASYLRMTSKGGT